MSECHFLNELFVKLMVTEADPAALARNRARFKRIPRLSDSELHEAPRPCTPAEPRTEEEQILDDVKYQILVDYYASTPARQFRDQKWEAYAELSGGVPGTSGSIDLDLYEQAEDIVRQRWKQQGIWRNAWNPAPENVHWRWKHQLSLAYTVQEAAEVAVSRPSGVGRKRKRPSAAEVARIEGERLTQHLRDYQASHPFHQFYHQLTNEFNRLNVGFEEQAIDASHINTTAYFNVKHIWIRRGIWDRNWGILPGMHWKHEHALSEVMTAELNALANLPVCSNVPPETVQAAAAVAPGSSRPQPPSVSGGQSTSQAPRPRRSYTGPNVFSGTRHVNMTGAPATSRAPGPQPSSGTRQPRNGNVTGISGITTIQPLHVPGQSSSKFAPTMVQTTLIPDQLPYPIVEGSMRRRFRLMRCPCPNCREARGELSRCARCGNSHLDDLLGPDPYYFGTGVTQVAPNGGTGNANLANALAAYRGDVNRRVAHNATTSGPGASRAPPAPTQSSQGQQRAGGPASATTTLFPGATDYPAGMPPDGPRLRRIAAAASLSMLPTHGSAAAGPQQGGSAEQGIDAASSSVLSAATVLAGMSTMGASSRRAAPGAGVTAPREQALEDDLYDSE